MNEQLAHKRHTLAHLLAAAVEALYPDAQPTLGPAIDSGFYYDFDTLPSPDLPALEAKMRELLPAWTGFTHEEVLADEAKRRFAGNDYKLELIDEINGKGEAITLYTSGGFTDLCRGGHVESPSKDIKPDSFKLSHTAGAYWRGDEKNTMLTRIYGLAFDTAEELAAYEAQQEEAKKRDHRKIGKELGLFFIDDLVGKGLALWLPKGQIIKDQVEKFAIETEDAYDYQRVATPHLAKEELFLTSGHLPYYKDGMYPPMVMDDGTYYLKAMNCPMHHVMYRHVPKSYRELPIRLAEYGMVYRNELSGTLAGLLRVRGLDMNDAHIYCRKDQIKSEIKAVMEMTMYYFKAFDLEDYWFRLSKWSPDHPEKYINQPENWSYSENIIREVLQEMGVPFKEADDEAAFYGPKIDAQFKSVIGREETMSTIQLDFLAKERFGLTYTDSEGKENNEVFVIHRAPLSTHERFMAFLIEHFGGAFPTWLSPEQVRILPISDKHLDYAKEIASLLKKDGVERVHIDDSNEMIGKKIRNWKLEKTPYAIVIGDKEMEAKQITVETRDGKKHAGTTVQSFAPTLVKEIADRSATLRL